MADDVDRLIARLEDYERRLKALETSPLLKNASVSEGRLRFIGGLLRVDAGGRVEIVGTLQVDGTSTVTGQFNVDGPFNLAGDGSITGQLTISGPVDITGDVDLTGVMTVTGDIEVTGAGRIKVGDVLIEDGKITAGNVVVEPNKITIGTGSQQATLEDGEFTLSNGAKLKVGLTGGGTAIGLVPPGGGVDISANGSIAWMRGIGSRVTVSSGQVNIDALFTVIEQLPTADSMSNKEVVVRDISSGRLFSAPLSLLG
jgi:cytoskeletal protein CcmA (bactofilin family)